MQWLIFIIVYPILWLISVLPFRWLYMCSDVLCFLIYRVIKYRRKVVQENLKLVFPERTEDELKHIEKRSYSHMCDVFLEMVKSLSISETSMKKRFTFKNIELLQQYEAQQRSVINVCGHYASWEWMMSLGYYIQCKGYAIYSPLKNKYFDQLVQKIRMRHKGLLISRYKTTQTLIKHKVEGHTAMYGFANDQSPNPKKANYWRSFMGVNVPVFTGAEMLAKKLDHVMVYFQIEKVKRGYYQTTFKLLSEHPKTVPDYELTDAFIKLLETQIRKKPEYYLWTHKRWKHRNKMPERNKQ